MKRKTKRDSQKTKSTISDRKKWIIGIIVTAIVSIVGTGILAPFVGSIFEQHFVPKPKIQILSDECALVPLLEDNVVAVKIVIKNTGANPEKKVVVRMQVESPWTFGNNTIWQEKGFENIASNQAMRVVALIYNPSVTDLKHGSVTISVQVYGDTKNWDSSTISDSW